MTDLTTSPEQCDKHDRCAAPICPLDPNWMKRTHIKGERVCFYLGEIAKRGGTLPETGPLPAKLAEAMVRAYPEVISRHGPLRTKLEAIAKTPSRLGRQPGEVEHA